MIIARPGPVTSVGPRTVLVTGGASGMGRIFSERMAQDGWQVAVLDRDAAGMAALGAACPGISTHCCDISDQAEVMAVADTVREHYGPIDRLVHCAAIFPTGRLDAQPEDSIHRLMAVNYGGTVNAVRAVLPGMQQRDSGEIIIFGSIGGAVPVPGCGAYCATKAAVNSFTETLIEEMRGSGVHVMLVCPPLVDTPLLQQATQTGNPRMVRDAIARRRFARPEAMIDAVQRGLARRKTIIFPAEAAAVAWLRRFSPGLVRAVLRAAGREPASGN